jgi:hypothetical protein
MATAPSLHAAFPSGPLTDDAGNLTSAWRGFFQSLYARTGNAVGTSSGGTATDLASETAERSAADTALSSALDAESTAREAADAAEAEARVAGDGGKLSTTGGTVSGPVRLNGGLGVLGHTAVTTRPVVTGAKGGNAALTSLLAALASYGLVTDSST